MRSWSKILNRAVNMFRCNVGCSCHGESCGECFRCNAFSEIVLNGSASISQVQATPYVELGAVWTDTLDGTGVLLVPTSGSVNINVPAVYVLTYTYINTQGNSATVIRTVTITATP